MPRWPDKEQTPVGQDKSVILPASGSIVQAVENLKDIEIVDKPMQDSYAEELAFMEEKLEVVVNEDTNPNAENPVQISVNGVNQFFMRGQPQVVKRKFVEVLARAKRRVAVALGGDRLILADAAQTKICVLLSISTLVALGLYAVTGAAWLDPVAGFVIAVFAVREGREAWEGELVEDDDDDD